MPVSPETEPTGEALWLDVERFAHEQLPGGGLATVEARAERARLLTERWQGTPAAFSILSEGVPFITRGEERVPDLNIGAKIESVTEAPGGGVEIKLDDDSCLVLPLHGKNADSAETCDSGWTATLSSAEKAA